MNVDSGSAQVELSYDVLKRVHRGNRRKFPTALALRTHRALSWLQRAEKESDDDDACFIFLWIALNAAYAHDIHDRQRFTERRLISGFIGKLVNADKRRLLHNAVWDNFSGPIRVLVSNKYVFQAFWDYESGRIYENEWLESFERSKSSVARAMSETNTKKVLAIVFDRLYTLRNQLVHGGATWNSNVNREQVADGVRIMRSIVPTLIHLMMERPDQIWGEPCYPVIDS